MAFLDHEPNPSPDERPPAGFHTSTTPEKKFVPDSFTNFTSNTASNPTISLPTRPSSYISCPSSEKPWRCAECAAASTPLPRRGPQGRKTLCNACGIRYGKRMREAKRAKETNNCNQQILRIRSRAQCETLQLPPENETAARRCRGITPESHNRRKLEKLSGGQCFISPLRNTAAPVVSQQETGQNPVPLSEGIETNFALTAAIREEQTTPRLTDANPTRAEHSTRLRTNARGLMMTTESPIPSSSMSAYPREPFSNHSSLIDQTEPVRAPVFAVPRGHTDLNFDSGEHVMESAIMLENVESENFAGVPNPTNAYQLTPMRLEGDIEGVDAGTTAYQRTFGEQDRGTFAMQCMEQLERLKDMSERLSDDIHSLNERMSRIVKKHEELEDAKQRSLASIGQLTNEQAIANTNQQLLCNQIAEAFCLLEHLR